MDRFRVIPDRARLRDQAVNRDRAPEGAQRNDGVGTEGCKDLTLVTSVGNCQCIWTEAHKNDLSEWWVGSITANLPKLLWGHNGRCIQSEADYHLALTLFRRHVSRLVTPDSYLRILPGTGPGNRGYIGMVEIAVQVTDPNSRILLASHSSKYPKTRKPNGVYHGQSTKISGNEHDFSFYDKGKQMKQRAQIVGGKAVTTTRIERRYRTNRRLAAALKEFTGMRSKYVATLSLPDAYALLRAEIGKLNGFVVTDMAEPEHPDERLALARFMAAVWEDLPASRQSIDYLMSKYAGAVQRSSKSVSRVRHGLGRLLAKKTRLTLDQIIPPDLSNFPWADIHKPFDELAHNNLIRQILGDDITTPDPDIVKAFSTTRTLEKVSGEKIRFGPSDGVLSYVRPGTNTR
jgi:hypothetical protein